MPGYVRLLVAVQGVRATASFEPLGYESSYGFTKAG